MVLAYIKDIDLPPAKRSALILDNYVKEILPGKEGLLHISQIDNKRVEKVSDYFKTGDKVKVKLIKTIPC